ncbi:hypothetical protein HWD99_08625 [Microbacterium sp. C5A9]|uniref:hypothetical protein n=1 Tax=Microbacterium sp. C5A9 TaxID=2736663 RepID=UPI001F520151|nr:hypothetical protein [Microbacterium sp. C5A9]MCI1018684.1 hypothetical protein [Microbacterium sp. C5A9]
MTAATAAHAATPPARLLPFLIGVGGGILGLLPWILGGARLPLQNLWVIATMPDAMPLVLLPVSQYYVIVLFAIVLLGGVFAGLAVRLVARRRALAVWPAALGVLAVHALAIVESFGMTATGLALGSDIQAVVYLVGLLGGAIAATLLAQLAFWMTLHRSDGIAAFGVALAAVPFGEWVGRWFLAFTGEVFPPVFLPAVVQWVPAIVVGLALVWCGVRPLRRLLVWVVSLLVLWLLPAVLMSMLYALGSRVILGDFAEMATAAVRIFPALLAEDGVLPVVAALVIGIVGTVVRMLVGRTSDPRPDTEPSPSPAPAGAHEHR